MSRRIGPPAVVVATDIVAGILCLVVAASCGDGTPPRDVTVPSQRAGDPPVGPAPAPGPARAGAPVDLGDGHGYDRATLDRFRRLLRTGAWTLAVPPRNAQGTLAADHVASGLRFVLVPAGRFRMGSENGAKDELPVREVEVGAFLLSRTECTQAAWDRIGGTDERARTHPNLPIDTVSWDDATAWCGRAGLRLPSEAEWEHACRAGTGSDWSFGGDATGIGFYASYARNSGGGSCSVAAREANPWGLHDLHGNLYEWCEDVHHAAYEGAPLDARAWTTPTALSYRVLRGGAWNETPWKCRSAARSASRPGFRHFILGFRPAASLP